MECRDGLLVNGIKLILLNEIGLVLCEIINEGKENMLKEYSGQKAFCDECVMESYTQK